MDALSTACPNVSITIVEVSTKGDRDKSDFLYAVGSVGFFTTEVERVLLEGRADVAVHSLKDLPTAITEGLTIAAIPTRQAVNDVVVASAPIASLNDLPKGAVVGTSSLRRITQLKRLRPDLDCQPLRGNVETRLRKVREGQYDAIVLAQAGLNRLGLQDGHRLVLEPTEFIPAPGQGALAVQTRSDDTELRQLVSRLEDPNARLTAETERRILAGLHGGCSIPLGVHARIDGQTIHIYTILCDLSGQCVQKSLSCAVEDAGENADNLTQEILNNGGREILKTLRRVKEGS
jgi:hydroxymethylbilane synthase